MLKVLMLLNKTHLTELRRLNHELRNLIILHRRRPLSQSVIIMALNRYYQLHSSLGRQIRLCSNFVNLWISAAHLCNCPIHFYVISLLLTREVDGFTRNCLQAAVAVQIFSILHALPMAILTSEVYASANSLASAQVLLLSSVGNTRHKLRLLVYFEVLHTRNQAIYNMSHLLNITKQSCFEVNAPNIKFLWNFLFVSLVFSLTQYNFIYAAYLLNTMNFIRADETLSQVRMLW